MTPENETRLVQRLEDIYTAVAGDGLHSKKGLMLRVEEIEKQELPKRIGVLESNTVRFGAIVSTITGVCIVLGWIVERYMQVQH